jgi:hypothetical protein
MGGWTAGWWLVVAWLAVGAQTAWAQTRGAQDYYAKYLDERLQRMTAELQLTAEQQAKVKAIQEEEIAATAKWTADYQALHQEGMAATRGKDEAARRAVQEKQRVMNDRRATISNESTAKIRAVITDAKWQAWLASELVKGWLKRLEAAALTDEQKEKIRSLCAESVRTQEATTNVTVKATAYRQLSDTIQNIVLGAQQREDVATDEVLQRVMRHLPGVEFTAEQKAKVKALCADAAKAARAAAGEKGHVSPTRAAREVEKKVMEQVMTQEQRIGLEGDRLYQQISYPFAACEPTPDQVTRMKALCQEAAKGWTQTTDYTIRSAKAKELQETIKSTILTEAQRAKLPPTIPAPVLRSAPATGLAPVGPPAPAAK